MAKTSIRMSAEERRESVIRAAMAEFALGGYEGTSTEAIARRVGVSQPYLFRLFPNKRAMFLAASVRCLEETIQTFKNAAEGLEDVEEIYNALATAYMELIEDRGKLMMQMQTSVAVFTAAEAGDLEFGEQIRTCWTELWDTSHALLGGDHAVTMQFVSCGMLINTMVALGYPPEHRLWSALDLIKH